MKKMIAILFVVFCATFYMSSAQNACPLPQGCNWSSEQTASVSLPGGCNYTVKYQFSKCWGECRFKIIRLNDVTSYCNGYSVDELLDAAAKSIVLEPWMTCLPDQYGCVKNIEGNMASCWKWDGLIGPGNPTVSLIPCNIQTCCIRVWEICDGVVFLSSTDNTDPCSEPLPSECMKICQ